MEFLNPFGLYALLLSPLLLIPYLIRGRPRQFVFSSLLLLKQFSSRATTQALGRLYLPPIFFLQLLLLLLLLLSLGEPVLSVRPLSVAIVVDNSASMQALEGRRSRFQLALDEAKHVLDGLPAGARAELYVTAPALARVTEEPLSLSAAVRRLALLAPLDLGEAAIDYGAELSRLALERGYERVYFFTDRPTEGRSETVRVVTVGRPRDNLAITAFQISRSSLASARLQARVEIVSFSTRAEKIKLSLKGGGKVLAGQSHTVPAGKSLTATFENIPFHSAYEAEIEAADGLALDNRRFAVSPASQALKILVISPRPQPLLSLRSIPGVEIKAISAEAYAEASNEPHALEIFHYSAPAALPNSHALFILPPGRNPLAAVGASLIRPVISGWREPHDLTRYVNFTLFRPNYARALRAVAAGDTIVQSPDGPLALALEQGGLRYVALGFDPFPFLGRENLPMSIFTLNLLGWFQAAGGGASRVTGEPLYLRSRRGDVLLTPAEEKIPLDQAAAVYAQTYLQGIYQLARGAERTLFAVNFQDARESDLGNPTAIQLKGEQAAAGTRPVYSSLRPYLLVASLLLLLLEWFLNPAPLRRGFLRSRREA
ncbi:MAG: hypothetical protein A3F90_16475 [Deltaproteobacteria bacterium RIFCSPLOWO2_12_FULL_60_19]|nr:MAG: hypothetical protein A3F90_16475 [Deltaproteobacteria bacterium RIFCSPLOWO2_12_FULL_60_19]